MLAAVALVSLSAAVAGAHSPEHPPVGAANKVAGMVNATVRPVLEKYRIPGMAVGIVSSTHSYVFNYGVATIAAYRILTALRPMPPGESH